MFICKFLCGFILSFLLGMCDSRKGLLGHMAAPQLTFQGIVRLFSKAVEPFYVSINSI